jgi:hypothetical protein
MRREKISLVFRIKHLFTHHSLLKIVSLVLAVMIWVYVQFKLSQ